MTCEGQLYIAIAIVRTQFVYIKNKAIITIQRHREASCFTHVYDNGIAHFDCFMTYDQ